MARATPRSNRNMAEMMIPSGVERPLRKVWWWRLCWTNTMLICFLVLNIGWVFDFVMITIKIPTQKWPKGTVFYTKQLKGRTWRNGLCIRWCELTLWHGNFPPCKTYSYSNFKHWKIRWPPLTRLRLTSQFSNKLWHRLQEEDTTRLMKWVNIIVWMIVGYLSLEKSLTYHHCSTETGVGFHNIGSSIAFPSFEINTTHCTECRKGYFPLVWRKDTRSQNMDWSSDEQTELLHSNEEIPSYSSTTLWNQCWTTSPRCSVVEGQPVLHWITLEKDQVHSNYQYVDSRRSPNWSLFRRNPQWDTGSLHQIQCSCRKLYLEENGQSSGQGYVFNTLPFLTLIDTEKTLEENGVNDEDDEFEELGIRDDYYVPALHLMYNDDLTIG